MAPWSVDARVARERERSPRDLLRNSGGTVAVGSGCAARRLFAANSPAIDKKSDAVARPSPADPGVLVLSRFAGAAERLKDALLVNPYDTDGTADTIQQALQMPLAERQMRHQRLLAQIRLQDVHWWRRSFLQALADAPVNA